MGRVVDEFQDRADEASRSGLPVGFAGVLEKHDRLDLARRFRDPSGPAEPADAATPP